MPVRSKAQWKWLAVNKPSLLHRWAHKYPRKYSSLPTRKKKGRARRRTSRRK